MPTPAIEAFIRRLLIRSLLTAEEHAALSTLTGTVESYGANETIAARDAPIDTACLIVEGIAGRFAQARDGTRQITAIHIPGDMPDLLSLALPRPSSALVAIAPTTILRIGHDALRARIRQQPGLAEAFWRDCMVDSAIGTEWVLNLGRHDARTRIAHLFCEMAARYQLIGRSDGIEFALPMNQFYLAEATGLTPIHVNRTLRGLREAGLLSVQGARATILDRAGLVRAGQFDPAYLMLDIKRQRIF